LTFYRVCDIVSAKENIEPARRAIMVRRKKYAVKPGLRSDWLRRYEQNGESPPEIAKADGYDQRTVRKQIELARREREGREARTMVLRNALEDHYSHLRNTAEDADLALSWPPPRRLPLTLIKSPMFRALKEHLPRSRIWRDLQKWDQLVDEYAVVIQKAKDKCKAEAEVRGLKFAPGAGKTGIGVGFVESIVSDTVDRARGFKSLKDIASFTEEKLGDTDQVQPRMGPWALGLIDKEKTSKLRTLYLKLLDEAPEWEEFSQLRRAAQDIQRLSDGLHEELQMIKLRGVVPGKCKYCPI
jgi:hypothetical protein